MFWPSPSPASLSITAMLGLRGMRKNQTAPWQLPPLPLSPPPFHLLPTALSHSPPLLNTQGSKWLQSWTFDLHTFPWKAPLTNISLQLYFVTSPCLLAPNCVCPFHAISPRQEEWCGLLDSIAAFMRGLLQITCMPKSITTTDQMPGMCTRNCTKPTLLQITEP